MGQHKNRPVIVAVDGPAGAGKSSVCSRVASALGWDYVNTGAVYRGLGLVLGDLSIDLKNEQAVSVEVDRIVADFRWDGAAQRLFYRAQDLTDRLGSNEAGYNASCIAKMPEIRRKLVALQRTLCLRAKLGVIVDGRDIGTVIFPDADIKIFMTASLAERAKRRLEQLGAETSLSLDQLQAEIARRDGQDATRDTAPMKKADDATDFDTTGLQVETAVERLIALLRAENLVTE